MSHLAYSLMLAGLLSGALALLGRRTARARLCVAGYTFVCCAFATVAGSWGMYLVHR